MLGPNTRVWREDDIDAWIMSRPSKRGAPMTIPTTITGMARLHPHWVGGEAGYVYSVIYDGKLLVERSRDPECDAARALLAKGITGKLTLLDGKTGKSRTVIDIEKAGKLRVAEESNNGLRFRTVYPATSGYSPQDEVGAA